MTITSPFGPQLIGETEKSLNAHLRQVLEGPGLSEPQWVAMRLADQLPLGAVEADLVSALAGRAHFSDTADIVLSLTGRGVLEDGRLTPSGQVLLADLQAQITSRTAPIWADLDPDDLAATERILTTVRDRARSTLV